MKNLTLAFFIAPFLIFSCGGNDNSTQKIEIEYDSTITKEIGTDYESVEFESLDGLLISANYYETDTDAQTIVLCHQARFNKFEYDGIAQRLNELGYNCLAIDQRSGGPIASQQNETNLRAREAGKGVEFLDAAQDITAAVNYAFELNNQPVILWGSSYSSTLVLYEAIQNENVSAVVSFSPGDYFSDELGSLVNMMQKFKKPFFVTSAKNEIGWAEDLLVKALFSRNQVHFKPQGPGWHGSRALWPNQDGNDEYWYAVTEFLQDL